MKINNITPSSTPGVTLNAGTVNPEAIVAHDIKNLLNVGQIAINNVIGELLDQLSQNINRREQLLASLPQGIEKITRNLVEQQYDATQTLALGMTALITSQRELPVKINAIIKATEDMILGDKLAQDNTLNDLVDELAALPIRDRQQTVQLLRQIISSLPSEVTQNSAIQSENTVLSLALPLYLENSSIPHPTYIHIFHKLPEQKAINNDIPQDTWVRIVTATQNIGTVEMIFHLYADNQLDIRVLFTKSDAARAFSEIVPEMRANFTETMDCALNLNITHGAEAIDKSGD